MTSTMDRGRRAWMAAAAAFLFQFIFGGLYKSFGVMLIPITQQYDITVWKYGNTISLSVIVGSLSCIISSPLMKVIHPRYLIMIAGFLTGSGLILTAFADTWVTASLLLILSGIGLRNSKVIVFSVLNQYFDKYYLSVVGFMFAGGSIGTIVFAPLSQLFLDNYGQWSALVLLGALSFNIIVCGGMIQPQQQYSKVKVMTGRTIEDTEKNSQRKRWFKAIIEWFDLDLFKDFGFITIMVFDFSVIVAWQTWVLYLIPHGIDKGLSPYQSSGLAISGGVAFFFGLIIPSFITKTGFLTEYQSLLGSFVLLSTSFFSDPLIDSFIGQLIVSAMCTFSVGVIYVVTMALVIKVSVTNVAQVVSYSSLFSGAGRYIGGLIPGILFDTTGNYAASFIFTGCVPLIAAMFAGVAIIFEQSDSSAKTILHNSI